jgi:hypothetical protein
VELLAVSNLQHTDRMGERAELLEADLLRYRVCVLDVVVHENLAVRVLAFSNVQPRLKTKPAFFLRRLDIRFVDEELVPASRDGIHPHVWRNLRCVKIQTSHYNLLSVDIKEVSTLPRKDIDSG